MKNIILLRDIGYAKKSVANWSYGVNIIIDESGSRYWRETFGGDSRMIEKMKAEGLDVDVLFTGGAEPVEFGVRIVEKMPDIEAYPGRNYPRE